ncbi:glutathione transferase GST 23-like [Nicotiana sylvestris]|uniref:Probable glutathione S-transferase n=1 Tax=Nicotiana sylvestris TaxID=4096 RepID=A0A1U7X7U7_NICSY|nr:PREDICTED: glutathione transferase GST 23-like [Nicotiana sylvestris]
MDQDLKLYGAWPSPYSLRIIWALKLKGLSYEYIEEDLANKSDLLLKYNPLHKKIPVLVHVGKPICESMVILEYLEEKWPNQYPLFPSDPYERAVARFWVKYFEEKSVSLWIIFRATGEEQERAVKDSLEMLKTIEEHGFRNQKLFFSGEKVGIVDIIFGWISHWLKIIEEVGGVKLLEENSFPNLQKWMKKFKEVLVIKESLPNQEKLFLPFKLTRDMLLAS